MSSAPVWTKKLARAVPATPSRRMSGWAQWWPGPHGHALRVERGGQVVRDGRPGS